MTFYDYERVRAKNTKYTKRKAYDIVHSFRSKGYEGQELHSELEKLLSEAETETQQEVLKIAMDIVKNTEEENGEEVIVRSFDYVDGRVRSRSINSERTK